MDPFLKLGPLAVLGWNLLLFCGADVYFLPRVSEPDPETAQFMRFLVTVVVVFRVTVSTVAGAVLIAIAAAWRRGAPRAWTFRAWRAVCSGLLAGAVGTFVTEATAHASH